MGSSFTLQQLVAEVERRIAALPAPRNGQVRAIPDERTVRYYGTIGLLDRPGAMRGRTALYGPRHVAQVIAIKRLQTMGRSLSEIQELWPTLDDHTLARMSGVELPARAAAPARQEFWKREPTASAAIADEAGGPAQVGSTVELRLELAPRVTLTLSLDERVAVTLSPADVRALRAAAAPLVAELASRRLAVHPEAENREEEP